MEIYIIKGPNTEQSVLANYTFAGTSRSYKYLSVTIL